MKPNAITICSALLIAAAALPGCISVVTSQPTWRQSFVVTALRPAGIPSAKSDMANSVLRLKRFRAAEPYDTRRMMVLDSRTRLITPAEGGQFAVAPAAGITDIARAWLAASGGFSDVVDPAALPKGDYMTLDAWIDQAGVVLDEEGNPSFRLVTSFRLDSGSGGAPTRRARYDYAVAVPLVAVAPADVSEGAGKAVAETLRQLEADLFKP